MDSWCESLQLLDKPRTERALGALMSWMYHSYSQQGDYFPQSRLTVWKDWQYKQARLILIKSQAHNPGLKNTCVCSLWKAIPDCLGSSHHYSAAGLPQAVPSHLLGCNAATALGCNRAPLRRTTSANSMLKWFHSTLQPWKNTSRLADGD